MSWQGIEGHDAIVEQFRQRLALGRMASTYLFVGPDGVGKRSFAVKLAQALLCQVNDPIELNPCGRCENCVQVEAGTHPDLLQVCKPADKSEIPVDLLIGRRENRMQEGLCHDIWLKPHLGGRRIALLDDADLLNEAGANCLLKTLEEPPPKAVMILIGTSLERQLPTIRSRSQIIRFQPLDQETITNLLVSRGLVKTADEARRLAAHSGGSLTKAADLADPALWQFRTRLLEHLSNPAFDSFTVAKMISAFVDEAGKEAPARRARARIVVGFVAEFFRQIARQLAGVVTEEDREVQQLIERATSQWRGGIDAAVACTQRTIEAHEHLDRYANQSTLIEAWIDELSGTMLKA